MHQLQAIPDGDLVAQVLERDAHAFEGLFERYAEPLCWYLVAIVRSEAAARDVVQEAFLRVWTRADQWDGAGSFRAWLYRIATNLALNYLRTVERRREVALELPPEYDDSEDIATLVPAWMVDAASLGPEAAAEQAEEYARVRRLVRQLPDDKREAFRLVHELELSLKEAADTLEVPVGTVKSRLHYARAQLARQWARDE